MPAVKNVGEPCAGEPHARIDVAAGGNQASRANTRRAAQAPPADPTRPRCRGAASPPAPRGSHPDGKQRVKPEGALEVHRRSFFLGVRADQCRVDVDHDPLRAHTQPPCPLPRPSARRADRVEQPRVVRDPVDQPKRRRVRRDRPEQRLLITHRPQVRQAVAAVGEHHRQIPDHPARIVPAASLAHPR
jgi:hypothetical protein